MSLLDLVHGKVVFERRVKRLAALLSEQLPQGASVLDVGCGDGSVAESVMERRPDLSVTGVDVLVRDDTRVAVLEYDGNTLPFEDSSFDAVMFVDVIHHTDDPDRMLAEAARVAGELVVVKDHVTDGVLAGRTLRLMDWVGNERHGVRLPYNYLTEAEWREMFRALDLDVLTWDTNLALYPAPLSLVFERRLQVLATLGRK